MPYTYKPLVETLPEDYTFFYHSAVSQLSKMENMTDSQQAYCGLTKSQKHCLTYWLRYYLGNKYKNGRTLDIWTAEWLAGNLGDTLKQIFGLYLDLEVYIKDGFIELSATIKTTKDDDHCSNQMTKLAHIPISFSILCPSGYNILDEIKYTEKNGYAYIPYLIDEFWLKGGNGIYWVLASFQGLRAHMTFELKKDEDCPINASKIYFCSKSDSLTQFCKSDPGIIICNLSELYSSKPPTINVRMGEFYFEAKYSGSSCDSIVYLPKDSSAPVYIVVVGYSYKTNDYIVALFYY